MTLGISIGSTPITGVYVGGTLATGVYFGSTKIWPASAGITFVDACTPVSSATSPSSLNLGLPAAAQAGDTVLADIISNVNQTGGGTYSNSGPAGSTKFVADKSFEWGGLHPGVGSAYAVRLTATDIANGYITFDFVNSGQVAIRGAVWRGVSETPIDVAAGIAGSAAATSNPFTFSAPGITPVTNGCTIVAGAGVLSTTTTALTDPSGYTVADVGNDINALQQLAYQKQTTAGPTGDVSITFGPDSTTNVQGWFAWLVALRPAGSEPAQTVDDFSVAGTINNWTITEQGSPTGSGTVSGGDLVLAPATGGVNAVIAERTGTWTEITVRASFAPLGSSTPRCFDLSLGSGSIVAVGGGTGWQNTTLSNGYCLQWNDGATVFNLIKMVSGNRTTLGSYNTNFSDTGAGLHDYGIRINHAAGTVAMVLDGVAQLTVNDATYASGTALIAQGVDSGGNGCTASISTVTLTP